MKIQKLIHEYEIALAFCGNGENKFSVNSILQTNKTFIEKAKELFKEEEQKQIKQLEVFKKLVEFSESIIENYNNSEYEKK